MHLPSVHLPDQGTEQRSRTRNEAAMNRAGRCHRRSHKVTAPRRQLHEDKQHFCDCRSQTAGENSVSYARRACAPSSSCKAPSFFKCPIAVSNAPASGSVTQSAAPLFFAHCTTADDSGAQMTIGRPAREYSTSLVAKHVSVRRRCAASKNITTKYAWNEPSQSSKVGADAKSCSR